MRFALRIMIVEINSSLQINTWNEVYDEIYRFLPMGIILILTDVNQFENPIKSHSEIIRLPHANEQWCAQSELAQFQNQMLENAMTHFGPDIIFSIDHKNTNQLTWMENKWNVVPLTLGKYSIEKALKSALQSFGKNRESAQLFLHDEITEKQITHTFRLLQEDYKKLWIYLMKIEDFKLIQTYQKHFTTNFKYTLIIEPKMVFQILKRSGRSRFWDLAINGFLFCQIVQYFRQTCLIHNSIDVELQTRHNSKFICFGLSIINKSTSIGRYFFSRNQVVLS